MGSANKPGFRIQQVADLTGIPRNTLLSWERRHRLIVPARAENGYRYYSQSDIDLLARVQELLALGHSIADAARWVQHVAPENDGGLDRVRAELRKALLDFDLEGAQRIRDRLSMAPFETVIDEVYLPLLAEVGDGWERGEIRVSQEHFASAFCRAQVVMMLSQLGSRGPAARRALCAGFPGEQHEVGLLAVAVKLALRGFSVTYLGNDVPIPDLCRTAQATGAEVLCQSVVLERPIEGLSAQIREISASLPDTVLLAIGGAGVRALVVDAPNVVVCHTFEDLASRL